MQQDDIYFRPPSEADSFIVRVMQGCSHNKCTFCNMFKGIPFSILPLEEIFEGMEKDAASLGTRFLPLVKSLYLEGGDPLCLPTQALLAILERAALCFPSLRRVVCYATARSIIRKPPDDFVRLGRAGLRCVFMGLESGSDSILADTRKGCTRADLLRANDYLLRAGIENDVSIMLGIGGERLSERHAVDTAALLNAMRPVCVRIRTFVPNEGTPLGEEYAQGRFTLLEPHAVLRELRLMVEYLQSPMRLLSEHWSDFIMFDARMPDEKEALLAMIDKALQLPRGAFRQTGLSSIRD